jgi:hypothetical protein
MEYAEDDKRLNNFVTLQFQTGVDKNKRAMWESVEFQFPPKVLSDSRRGTWDEQDVMGTEPIAIYGGSGPRNISMQITYLVDGDRQGSWNCTKITKQIRLMRGYFQRIQDYKAAQRNLVVKLKLWCIGGRTPMTFRLRSCDVKYGETMITNKMQRDSSVESSTYFPLRTDVTLDLSSWTQGAYIEPGADGGVRVNQGANQFIEDLDLNLIEAWY